MSAVSMQVNTGSDYIVKCLMWQRSAVSAMSVYMLSSYETLSDITYIFIISTVSDINLLVIS